MKNEACLKNARTNDPFLDWIPGIERRSDKTDSVKIIFEVA